MSGVATWIRERVPSGRPLDRETAAALAQALAAEPRLWRHLVRHDADTRHYVQLYRDPALDVWLICWLNAQDTGYHDHDVSLGAVHVVEGTLCEDSLGRDPDGWIRERTREHAAGSTFDFDAAYIHGVRHPGGPPATSIHVYSPALWRMGHYEPDESGMLGRHSITYVDELAESDVTIGDVDTPAPPAPPAGPSPGRASKRSAGRVA